MIIVGSRACPKSGSRIINVEDRSEKQGLQVQQPALTSGISCHHLSPDQRLWRLASLLATATATIASEQVEIPTTRGRDLMELLVRRKGIDWQQSTDIAEETQMR